MPHRPKFPPSTLPPITFSPWKHDLGVSPPGNMDFRTKNIYTPQDLDFPRGELIFGERRGGAVLYFESILWRRDGLQGSDMGCFIV